MWVGEAFQKKKACRGHGGEREQGTAPCDWNSPYATLTHCRPLCDALTLSSFEISFLTTSLLLKVSQEAGSCTGRSIWYPPLFPASLETTSSFSFSPFLLQNASKSLLTNCPQCSPHVCVKWHQHGSC